MNDRKLKELVRCLRTMAGDRQSTGLTDCQLLLEFLAHTDQTAFTALVERHGPMVEWH